MHVDTGCTDEAEGTEEAKRTEEDECTEEPGEEACSAPVQCDCLGRICFQIRSDNENK